MDKKFKEILQAKTKDVYPSERLEESVNALEEFISLVEKECDLKKEDLIAMTEERLEERKKLAKSFNMETMVLKPLCKIVDHKEYTIVDSGKYKNQEFQGCFFKGAQEYLCKKVFELVPIKQTNGKDFSLGHYVKAENRKDYQKEYNTYPFICQIMSVYQSKNGSSHKEKSIDNYDDIKIANLVADIYVVLLHLSYKYRYKLHEKYSFERFRRELKSDWKEKCDSVYKEMMNKIGYIDFKWESNTRHTTEDIALQNSEKLKNESWLKLVGMAGSGKTTALRHINHLLLENYDKDNIFPVFFELQGLAEAKGDFLQYMIKECYDVSESAAESLKETDKLIFLLDGYDEIKDIGIQGNFARKIEKYAKEHKSVRIIMTDRTEKNSIPVLEDKFCYLRLCSIGKEDKKEYFKKNCKDEEILNLLIDSLEDNNIVFRCLKTPLKLKHFMELVSEIREIPDETTIMRKHIERLFDRERIEKKDINIEVLEDYLKVTSFLLNDDERAEETEIQVYTNKSVGNQSYDIKKALKLAENMGILEKTTDTLEGKKSKKTFYKFSDVEYLEYYGDMLRENKILRKTLKKIKEELEE